MSSLEQRQKLRPTEIDDPDFDACVAARQAMTQPCYWVKCRFYKRGLWNSGDRACWAGRILLALGSSEEQLESCDYLNSPDLWNRFVRITQKLGFEYPQEMFNVNDAHSHPEVIAEFDRRLQQWGEA